MKRSSGVLMHISSLPSNYGIGTMGKWAYKFVDFLKASGQSYWQLLPLGPAGYGDSPYAAYSSFAGNTNFIDLDLLVKDGLLRAAELKNVDWGGDLQQVDYKRVNAARLPVLRKAFCRGRDIFAEEYRLFRQSNCRWIENYALYMALKQYFGTESWTLWPDEGIRLHRPEAVEKYKLLLSDEVDFHGFLQFLFYRQWNQLKEYAHENGVQFIGDIPIYVPLDSADVWSEPEFFLLDGENKPTEVSGVPPDDYCEDGQLWGNPLYNWETMRNDGYGWWIRRMDGARKLYDMIRIDHFRGLESYWSAPAGDTDAKNGHWVKGPGMSLVGVLRSWFGDLRLIAEDLGFITPEVRQLLADSGLPGMKVLMFAFDSETESDYLPHNCASNSVCYIGTHDNDTVKGWLKTISKADKSFAKSYMNISEDEGWCWGMIRSGMATASELFIAQMQDVLELGGESRMNTPGTVGGNWQWRMLPDAIDKKLIKKLRYYTETFRRM